MRVGAAIAALWMAAPTPQHGHGTMTPEELIRSLRILSVIERIDISHSERVDHCGVLRNLLINLTMFRRETFAHTVDEVLKAYTVDTQSRRFTEDKNDDT